LKVDNKLKLIVSISLLQRSLAVEIDREWARPVGNGAGPAFSVQGTGCDSTY
jgi:hypothetical protein